MLPDHRFQLGMQALCIHAGIACHLHRRIETQDVVLPLFVPEGETGNHRRPGAGRDTRKAGVGTSRFAEEIDKEGRRWLEMEQDGEFYTGKIKDVTFSYHKDIGLEKKK